MRRSVSALLSLLPLVVVLTACGRGSRHSVGSLADVQEWVSPEYAVDGGRIKSEIGHQLGMLGRGMYADSYTHSYYNRDDAPMLWVTRMGVIPSADTLLANIEATGDIGLYSDVFHVDTLKALLDKMQRHDFAENEASRVLGRLECMLTHAYLRYACGQRYGYMRPGKVMNHLLVDPPAPGEVRRTVVYRQIYDHGSEEVTDSFVHHALEQVRGHRLTDFLREVQPADTLYRRLLGEYRQAKDKADTTRIRLARINLERARWRYPHPSGGRYIFVNLAGQELTAVNAQRDTVLNMRVCCGNRSHKTPLLHSAIRYVELNPYWVIPQTIVRKEILPYHVGDYDYFTRNNYRAIDKDTHEELDPGDLTAGDLRSGRYTLRQENGAGNSLGRIIFRFPNNFSVYLHDTNNHRAFHYGNRAISHGCVRVERPLDLALFFLDNPTAFYIDRIRMAIDLPPLTAQGKQYKAAHPDARPMGSFSFAEPVPVWLDYWTLYPTPGGAFRTYEDNYGYDAVIEDNLKKI
ncbi:MAG: L,D-transpeptidase family protein [Bacteroidaceae bacterium]|nr:L,D-transpeptidase family protein [Bacteroidaceae bacterium]